MLDRRPCRCDRTAWAAMVAVELRPHPNQDVTAQTRWSMPHRCGIDTTADATPASVQACTSVTRLDSGAPTMYPQPPPQAPAVGPPISPLPYTGPIGYPAAATRRPGRRAFQ